MSYKTYEVRVYEGGSRKWFMNGTPHREDGPAIELADGTRTWLINGELHREDGPANESPDGSRWWYLNGELHREDGPAVIFANGKRSWYLNGKYHTEAEWREATNPVKELTVKEVEKLLGHPVKIVKE